MAPPFDFIQETADEADHFADELSGDGDFASAGADGAPASHEELWEALVSGRWTVIGSADEPQHRWLVLRRNCGREVRPLTAREREVVRRVATGSANKAIAIDLGVTPSAVARTLKRALRKMQLRSRADLARLVPGSAAK